MSIKDFFGPPVEILPCRGIAAGIAYVHPDAQVVLGTRKIDGVRHAAVRIGGKEYTLADATLVEVPLTEFDEGEPFSLQDRKVFLSENWD